MKKMFAKVNVPHWISANSKDICNLILPTSSKSTQISALFPCIVSLFCVTCATSHSKILSDICSCYSPRYICIPHNIDVILCVSIHCPRVISAVVDKMFLFWPWPCPWTNLYIQDRTYRDILILRQHVTETKWLTASAKAFYRMKIILFGLKFHFQVCFQRLNW